MIRARVRVLAALVCLAGLGSAGAVETIYLKSGPEVEGEVLGRTAQSVTVRVAQTGAVRAIRTRDIDFIIYTPDEPKVAVAGSATQPAVVKEAAKTPLEAALEKLTSGEAGQRSEAKETLKQLEQAEVLRELQVRLYHQEAEMRAACASLLGELAGQGALKALVEALYAAVPSEGQAPDWQQSYIRALATALEGQTGQMFIGDAAGSQLREGVGKYVTWYNANYLKLPAQLGANEPDPEAEGYTVKLAQARRLNLERREWTAPKTESRPATTTPAGTAAVATAPATASPVTTGAPASIPPPAPVPATAGPRGPETAPGSAPSDTSPRSIRDLLDEVRGRRS